MKQLQEMLKPYFAEWQTQADITAVLKYMSNKTEKDFTKYDTYCGYIRLIPKYDYQEATKYRLPNKPLHLYTEQENKNLLELLKKLK